MAECDVSTKFPLVDSTDLINTHVNAALTDYWTTTSNPTALGASKDLSMRFGWGTAPGWDRIETWVENLPAAYVHRPFLQNTKYKGVETFIRRIPWWGGLNPPMALGSHISVDGHLIGADKLAHLLFIGRWYWLEMYDPNGIPVMWPLHTLKKRAIMFGWHTELTYLGLETTGVFSSADLEANLDGLRLHEQLVRRGRSFQFDIRNYIDNSWDEEREPNLYSSDIATRVWRNILTKQTWRVNWQSFSPSGVYSIDMTFVESNTTPTSNLTGTFTTNNRYTMPRTTGTISNLTIQYKTTTITAKYQGTTTTKNPVHGIKLQFTITIPPDPAFGPTNQPHPLISQIQMESAGENYFRGTWGTGGHPNVGRIYMYRERPR